jgi:hypothetical protein
MMKCFYWVVLPSFAAGVVLSSLLNASTKPYAVELTVPQLGAVGIYNYCKAPSPSHEHSVPTKNDDYVLWHNYIA